MFTILRLIRRAARRKHDYAPFEPDLEPIRHLDPEGQFLEDLTPVDRMYLKRVTEEGSGDPIPGLLDTLKRGDENLRPSAARLIGLLAVRIKEAGRAKEAVQELINALYNPPLLGRDPRYGYVYDVRTALRIGAATALGQIGDIRATLELSEGVFDPHPGVRRATAVALGMLGSPDSVAALEKALDDTDGEVKAAARASLTQIGTEEAREALRQWRERNKADYRR